MVMLSLLRSEYLMLGNLTAGYSKPCVLDLKVAKLTIIAIMIIFTVIILIILETNLGWNSNVRRLCEPRKT